jgi:DNA-binding NarL/FixJ family response regulator
VQYPVKGYTDHDHYNMTARRLTRTKTLRLTEDRAVINILLVDDKPAVLHSLQLRLDLEPDLEVVGEAYDGKSALTLAQTLHPDVVVMDIKMPGMDGIAATERLRELAPDVVVIVLTIHDDADTKSRAFQAGAAAFVEKRALPDRLLTAIRAKARGAA